MRIAPTSGSGASVAITKYLAYREQQYMNAMRELVATSVVRVERSQATAREEASQTWLNRALVGTYGGPAGR